MNEKLREHLKVRIFVQVNDVYHIDYLMDPADPKSFILPRVETLLSRFRVEYGSQNVYFCLPGDFLNPANLSRIHRSRQMIDVLNHMRLSVASFGNHEFDFYQDQFTPDDLAQRVSESNFIWLASNYVPSGRFGDGMKSGTLPIKNMIGGIELAPDHFLYIIGLMYPGEFSEVGRFTPPIEQCGFLIDAVKNDFFERDGVFRPARATIVAMTHQDEKDDIALAEAVPSLRLIMGGHDHDLSRRIGGDSMGPLIVKALSNARTVRLNFVGWIPREVMNELRTDKGNLPDDFMEIAADLSWRPLLECALEGAALQDGDPDVQSYKEEYFNRNFDPAALRVHDFKDDGCVIVSSVVVHTTHPGFRKLVEPEPSTTNLICELIEESSNYGIILAIASTTLDTDDKQGRSRSTNFGNFVTDCFTGMNGLTGHAQPVAHVGLMDGGSFRLDRKIVQGEQITEGTLGDLLFYDNELLLYSIRGDVLLEILRKALTFRPTGGEFLQISGLEVTVTGEGESATISAVSLIDQSGLRETLEAKRYYEVATTSYVAGSSSAYGAFFARCTLKRQLAASVRELVRAEIQVNGIRIPSYESRWVLPE